MSTRKLQAPNALVETVAKIAWGAFMEDSTTEIEWSDACAEVKDIWRDAAKRIVSVVSDAARS